MSLPRSDSRLLVWSAAFFVSLAACGSSGTGTTGEGGSPGTGGSGTGGTTGTGGNGTGGNGTGGNGTGGNGTGGNGTGGNGTGGNGTGGNGTGGHSTGGAGGSATGGTGTGGVAGGGGRGTGGAAGGAGRAGSGGAGGAVTGSGGSGGASAMSSGCGKAPTIASSMYNNGKPISITAANMQRRYILSVPTNYDNTKPYKLVIAYHALNSNDHSIYNEKYYDLQPALQRHHDLRGAERAAERRALLRHWNRGFRLRMAEYERSDMQLADAVVKQVEDNFCVDTNRIFATGWSYGASMSEQTACERPLGGTQAAGWGVRGIAIYAVAYLSNSSAKCKATKPVAYYATHGTCDSVLTLRRNGQVLDDDRHIRRRGSGQGLGRDRRLHLATPHEGDQRGARLHQADRLHVRLPVGVLLFQR